VAWTGSSGDYADFAARHGLTFPSLDDTPGSIYDRFEVPYQPAFAIVRPDGTVETLLGAGDDAIIDMLISAALS